MMMKPKISMCNIFPGMEELRIFARKNGFDGIDWSFDLDTLPRSPGEASSWVKRVKSLEPLEVRYHCPFYRIDLGHDDREEAKRAESIFQRIIRLVSKAEGRYLTIHIGLGHDSTESLSWERSVQNLRSLVQYGFQHQVTICLENLAWGWTSKPNLFEKLIRQSGAAITLDIGHAWSSETVRSQYYAVEDFVTPHADRVLNAHIYHREIPAKGHIPPAGWDQIEDRLKLLYSIGCAWWVIEIKEAEGLLATKKLLDEHLPLLLDPPAQSPRQNVG
jgi:sugar phosphate isomerase/epimerase